MLRRSFWGRGYASEGARAALQFAFTRLGRPHVISLIHPGNAASIRVAQRLDERLLDSAEVMGKPALVYRITKEEWETRHKELQPTEPTVASGQLPRMFEKSGSATAVSICFFLEPHMKFGLHIRHDVNLNLVSLVSLG